MTIREETAEIMEKSKRWVDTLVGVAYIEYLKIRNERVQNLLIYFFIKLSENFEKVLTSKINQSKIMINKEKRGKNIKKMMMSQKVLEELVNRMKGQKLTYVLIEKTLKEMRI